MKRIALLALFLFSVIALHSTLMAQDEGPEFIELGASIPLSGRYAGPAIQVERGYTMAIEDINAAGGIYVAEYDRQIPINLSILDDESDPVKAVENLEDLYSNEDVVVYLGGFGSDMHAAASAVGELNATPYVGVAFALWDVHQQGFEYLFSPFPKSPELSVAMFEMLSSIDEEMRPSRVGIIAESTDWGIELTDFWTADAEEYGFEVVAVEEYTPGTQDFSDIILSMQDADVEIMLSLPNPPDGIALATQMAELDWAPAFSNIIRAPDAPTWIQALGANGDFVAFMPGWHHAMAFEGVDALNEKHMEMMGRPSDPLVGPAYATVQVVAAAIEAAGTLDRDAIRDAIAASDLETVIGNVTFNEDGTGNVPVAILQYQGGKPELVWPAEFATAELVYPAPAYADREAIGEEE